MSGTRYPFEVRPVIPAELSRLEELAGNLLYSWNRKVRALFYQLDAKLWEDCRHNPKVFLRRVSQERLNARAHDPHYLLDYATALQQFDAYQAHTDPCNCAIDGIRANRDLVAYFCMEYGLHESLKLYSGGLGVLAGDHCKAVSDLGLPFVAIGLMYRLGYFEQRIAPDGSQQAFYHPADLRDLPVTPVMNAGGERLVIQIAMPARAVALCAWRVDIGHVPLYLLDSDLPENTAPDRAITYQLYGGDRANRLAQEIVLGIGGVKLLRALNIEPTVWHANEGHAALLILERCREAVHNGLDFDSALEQVAANTVFTTHTPVPAGHDLFARELVTPHFQPLAQELGVSLSRLLALGDSPLNSHEFNLTALALRGSRQHNGVSRTHGKVASAMSSYIWPQIDPDDNPIGVVANGVHVPTFIAREWSNLFDARFPEWRSHLHDVAFWEEAIASIPDHRFWSLRQSLKSEMLEGLHELLLLQYQRNRFGIARIHGMREELSVDNTRPLTIGFARRFATYKRALLLFDDPERLARLLNDEQRPVRLFFAGKAHPQDMPGQQLIRRINEYAAQPEFLNRLFFVEDYDLALARKLVTGTDVWLNTPEYPQEASGTSGQKAAANGVLNLSVLDGWWADAYDGTNGWAIPPHDHDMDPDVRDRLEADELMDLLEREIVPRYFAQEPAGHAPGWVRMSKASMTTALPRFSAHRMVMEYIDKLYVPAIRAGHRLHTGNSAAARALAQWKSRVRENWSGVSLRWLEEPPDGMRRGEAATLTVAVRLNGLTTADVRLECLLASRDPHQETSLPEVHPFEPLRDGAPDAAGETLYRLRLSPAAYGLLEFQVHLYPWQENLSHRFELGLRLWL